MTVIETTSDSDIAKKLPDLQFHDQDGDEDHDRGQSRNEDGAPNLGCAPIGGLAPAHALFAQAVDVLQHHNGCVDDHADGEG